MNHDCDTDCCTYPCSGPEDCRCWQEAGSEVPRLNGKFVSQKRYDEYMAEQAASEESNVTDTVAEETEAKERKTRQADPLLAAKRRLETARKRQAKAAKKMDSVSDIATEFDAANDELEAAEAAFQAAVAAV